MKKLILAVPIVMALLACSCNSSENVEPSKHSVLTITPAGSAGQTEKHFSGVVNEKASINLGFKTAGQIEKIFVKEGDYIRKGQLLAQLDSKDYMLGLESSEAKYEQMKNEIARMEKLYQSKSISGNDYEKAVAGFKQLGVQLQSDKNKVAYTKLYAPEDGLIQEVNFDPAEMVNAGTPVFVIMSTGRMKVEVNLPQSIYQQKDKIQKTTCEVNGKTINLRLESITPKADDTQLYKALFAFEGQNKGITAGMNVSVDIKMKSEVKGGTLTVPLRTIFEDAGKSYVWVIKADSCIKKTEVQVGGLDKNGDAIINKGLNGDETIVRAGVHSLIEGEKVIVLTDSSETNVGGQL